MTAITAQTRSPRRLVGGILILFSGAALIFSAALKFVGVPGVVHQMAADGFAGGKLTFIATLEICGTALFLWPRTRSIGLLLVSSYLGGAICLHVQLGEYPKSLPPALLLSLAWVGTWLRHPQAFWSLTHDPSNPNSVSANRTGPLASGHPA